MNAKRPASTKAVYYVLLAGLIACVLSSAFMMPYVPDDSYISFRYAENLVHGHGLTFNPGEQPVEAYSNLLWILLCALFYSIGLDLPSFAPYMGVTVALLNIFLLWILLRRREMPALQMLVPIVLLAGSGPFMMYAVSGLEAPLFAALMLLAMVWIDSLLSTGRILYFILLAVSCVMLSLCRPEGIVAFPIIAVELYFVERRRAPGTQPSKQMGRNLAAATAVFVLIMIVYNIWRVRYFGEWLPTPFLSKAGGGKSMLSAWVQNLSIYFTQQGDYFPPIGYYFGALSLVAAVGVLMSKSRAALRTTERLAFVTALIYFFIYFNFKDWMPGMRYNSAFVGLLLLPAAQVQAPFFERAAGSPRSRTLNATFWLGSVAVVMMSCSVLAELRVITKRVEISNQECLVKLGEWFRQNLPSNSVLAMSDVGAVPYYSRLKTIDIHPESLTDLYIAKHGFSNDYFYRLLPDVVVFPARSIFLTWFYPEHYSVGEDARFQKHYRLLAVSRYDWYNDRCYWVFVKNTIPEMTPSQMDQFPPGIGSITRKLK